MNNYIIRKINNINKKKYKYYNLNNKEIKNKKILEELYKIYIPPAYKDVRIYFDQKYIATGIDVAGRKQYIYNENSKKNRENKKYYKLVKLGKNIKKIKNKIKKDLLNNKFTKNKLIASILKIMELCNFRGGSKVYEKKYSSYGLTTLHKKHVKFNKNITKIDFVGKKGVNNSCIIMDKNIQNIIKNIYKISSKENSYLFSISYNNKNINISMNDINQYLKEFKVTAKDLRTWNANIIFLKNLKKNIDQLAINFNDLDNNKKIKIKKNLIKESIKSTSNSLHHTPYICKNSYIYKNILKNIENNDLIINKLKNENIDYEKLLYELL